MLKSLRPVDASFRAASRLQPHTMGYKTRKELPKARSSSWLWTDWKWQRTRILLKGLVLEILELPFALVCPLSFWVYQRGLSTEGEWLTQLRAEWRCTDRFSRMQACLDAAAKWLNWWLSCALSPSQSWHSLPFWRMLTSLQPLRLAKVIPILLAQTEPHLKPDHTESLKIITVVWKTLFFTSSMVLKLLLNHITITSQPLQTVCL